MLIGRAEELCGVVGELFETGNTDQASEWLLRIRDILGELLSGVTDASNPLGKTVADFYVFLIQLVTEIEQTRSPERLVTLRDLLAIESETWRLALEMLESAGVQAPIETDTAPSIPPPLEGYNPLSGGTFSLEV